MKKKDIAAGTAAGIVAAGAIAGVLMNTEPAGDGHYAIDTGNEYVSQMTVEIEENTYDLAELYLGSELIDRAILPFGKFEAQPIVFKGVKNLRLELYENGKHTATGSFDEDGGIEIGGTK